MSRVILWPRYFDSGCSRRGGRRVPKSLAVPSPGLEELVQAARRLGLRCEAEEDRAHPAEWWEPRGRLLVEKSMPKGRLLRLLAQELRRARSSGS
jgi:signal recognition particle subunit SRP19